MRPGTSSERPVAHFEVNPDRPSTADLVQFSDHSHDPQAAGIAWRVWDFGDGTTGVGSRPLHRYSTPGPYEVTLTLATFDGRVSCATQVVRISKRSRS